MRAASSGSSSRALSDADTGPHPRADRSRHRRGFAGGDRGRDHGADHRAAARRAGGRASPRQGGVMKFGAVAPKEAIGGTAVHTIRQGAMVLKKGTLIGPVEAAALEAAGIKDIVVARLEPGDVSEDVAAADIAAAIAGERRACRSRLYRPRQSVRAMRPACWSSTRMRSTASTASTRRSPWRRCRPTSRSSPAR